MKKQKFYQLSLEERRQELLNNEILSELEVPDVELEQLNQLSENVIGRLSLPVGVVQNVQVNQKEFTVPLATEEPSVVAAANHGISIFNKNNGVTATSKRDGLYGQAFFLVDKNFDLETFKLDLPDLITDLNQNFVSLVNHGGGVKNIELFLNEDVLEVRLLVDPAQAMGANKINSILEYLSEQLIDFPGIIEKLFAILSNYPSQLTTASVSLDFATLTKTSDVETGKEIARNISLLSYIAQNNPYRATTNNKGIMNGVDAVLLATGNDFRAVEVATNALAAQSGQYQSLSKWEIRDNKLVGQLTLPMPIGVVGGSIKSRKDVQESLEILNYPDVKELAEVIVAIGLANNFAALLAISTKGIQAGHMKLQAKNLASAAGATLQEQTQVVKQLIETGDFSLDNAREIIERIRGN